MNQAIVNKSSEYFKKKGVVLPTISELCDPHTIDGDVKNKLKNIRTDKRWSSTTKICYRVHCRRKGTSS